MRRRYAAAAVAVALVVSLFALHPYLIDKQPPGTPGGSISGSNPDPAPAPAGKTLPTGFLGGVIEGYYGAPWSTVDTLDMIKFIGDHGMNTFVYAPKDDPFQRSRWRDPYPADGLQKLAELVAACKDSGVKFVYSLSPGLSITYSDPADAQALNAKFDQLRTIGVDVFMLSFDDISNKLKAADAKVFNDDLALAQATVTNALMAHESAADVDFELVFVPTTYSGTKDNPYWQSLKAHLDKRAAVIWTGPKVLSPTITAAQAEAVAGYIGHRLIIWDNYPTNDYTFAQPPRRPKLFLGPVTGRDAGLPGAVAGYWYNPMEQGRASKLALATGFDYLLDPAAYDPAAAWARAIAEIGGPVAAQLRLLAENASSYYYANPAPPKLAADLASVWTQPAATDLTKTAAFADFRAFEQLATDLKALPDAALYAELKPWLDALAKQGQVGRLALAVLQAQRQKLDAKEQMQALKTALAELKGNKYSIAGDAVVAFAEKVVGE